MKRSSAIVCVVIILLLVTATTAYAAPFFSSKGIFIKKEMSGSREFDKKEFDTAEKTAFTPEVQSYIPSHPLVVDAPPVLPASPIKWITTANKSNSGNSYTKTKMSLGNSVTFDLDGLTKNIVATGNYVNSWGGGNNPMQSKVDIVDVETGKVLATSGWFNTGSSSAAKTVSVGAYNITTPVRKVRIVHYCSSTMSCWLSMSKVHLKYTDDNVKDPHESMSWATTNKYTVTGTYGVSKQFLLNETTTNLEIDGEYHNSWELTKDSKVIVTDTATNTTLIDTGWIRIGGRNVYEHLSLSAYNLSTPVYAVKVELQSSYAPAWIGMKNVQIRYTINDTTPPATVTGLGETSVGQNWIYWQWTNPSDSDFNHVELWIDGVHAINTSNSYYNATGFSPNSTHMISTRTADTGGNINTTWVNDSATTLSLVPDTTPPGTVTGLGETSVGMSWIYWQWTNPSDSDFNHTEIWVDGIFTANTSNSFYNATGFLANSTHYIGTRTADHTGNINTTWINDSATTLAAPDTTPPGTITNLSESAVGQTWILWNWTNPSDSDFNHVEVWVNGTHYTNTSNSYYNATGLLSNTTYEIQTRTADNAGNVNTTWVNDTAKTLASVIPDTTPPATVTGLNETAVGQTWILWNWTNPADIDFNHTEIWIDGVLVINTSNNYYNATGFLANSTHYIGTRTADHTGNINTTWVNDSATTLASSDTTPPATVTNLNESAVGTTWVMWNWTNPSDSDFNHTEIWIDSVFAVNTSNSYYNATGLTPNMGHTIGTRTADHTGNINTTWVLDSAFTLAVNDTTKPVVGMPVLSPNPVVKDNVINISANVTDDVAVHTVLFRIDSGTYVAPTGSAGTIYWYTGANTSVLGNHTVDVWANDTSGNTDAVTGVIYTVTNVTDTTPPATVTGLNETAVEQLWIYWQWTNPIDSDFNHVEVWMDGIFATNTSNSYYNATGFTANTTHMISTRTADNSGNVNTTWVNDTATTLTMGPVCYCNGCADCASKMNNPICTDIRMTADVANHSGDCIRLPTGFQNKVFDCRGHTIDGDDSGNDYGIRLGINDNNTIQNCVITDFDIGIRLYDCDNNTITGNTLRSNNKGMNIDSTNVSNKNTIMGNTIDQNVNYGIYIAQSNDNLIYNNYLNNTKNAQDSSGKNYWNTTKAFGTNIANGPYIGGNFWSDYNGTDTNNDSIGDTNVPYNKSIANGGDYLPLIYTAVDNAPVINWVTDSPDPVNQGAVLTISANITDDVNVTTVYFEVGGINYTETGKTGSNVYWFTGASTSSIGTFNYTVHANDTAGQWAIPVSGTYTVIAVVAPNNTIINSTIDSTYYSYYVNSSDILTTYSNISGGSTVQDSTGSRIIVSESVGNLSTMTDSELYKGSYAYNSILDNATLINTTALNVNLSDSTFKNSYLDPSTIINSTTSGSKIINSYLRNSHVNNSYVDNSTILNMTVLSANITDDVFYSGTIIYNGNTYNSPPSTNMSTIYGSPDTTPPVVTLTSPGNSTTDTDGNVTFTYTANELGKGIASCTLYLNGMSTATDTSVASGIAQSFNTMLFSGNYTWYVNCVDLAGNNASSATRNLQVSVASGVWLDAPADKQAAVDSNVIYNIILNNIGLSNDTYNIIVNNTDGADVAVASASSIYLTAGGNASFTLTVGSSKAGTYDVELTAQSNTTPATSDSDVLSTKFTSGITPRTGLSGTTGPHDDTGAKIEINAEDELEETETEPLSLGVSVELQESYIELEPGEEHHIIVYVRNVGNGRDVYTLQAIGPEWASLDDSQFGLSPGESGATVLTITPPEDAGGTFYIGISVESRNYGDRSEQMAQVEVLVQGRESSARGTPTGFIGLLPNSIDWRTALIILAAIVAVGWYVTPTGHKEKLVGKISKGKKAKKKPKNDTKKEEEATAAPEEDETLEEVLQKGVDDEGASLDDIKEAVGEGTSTPVKSAKKATSKKKVGRPRKRGRRKK